MRLRPDRTYTARFAAERPDRHGSHPRFGAPPNDTGPDREPTDDSPAPAAPVPYVTIAILVLISVIFVTMMAAGHGDVTRVALKFGAKDNLMIRQGQYWRLVTPIFLHGGWLHLLVNGYSLYQLGGSIERIYGAKKYLLIFLFAGIMGNVLSYRLSPTLSLGASGALFGLVGAGLVFPIRFRDLIPPQARASILRQLSFVAIINLAIGFSLQGIIDNWAHVGGLLGGAFIALFLIPDVLQAQPRSAFAESVLTSLVMLSIGIVAGSGLLQWRWARQHPSISLISYLPVSGPAWWSLSVPARWKLAGGEWHAPDDATIRVSEHMVADLATRVEVQSLVSRRKPINVELDGKPGWYTTAVNRLQYRIPVYDRLFELTLETPAPALKPQDQSDFAAVAGSVRFMLPPAAFSAAAPR